MNNLLIVTSAEDEHVSHAEGLLRTSSLNYLRFNTEDFPQKVDITARQSASVALEGVIKQGNTELLFEEITHVWFRKPRPPIISEAVEDEGHRGLALQESESTLNWIYQALRHPLWMNHPDANHQASSKLLQIRTAAELGFNVPRTLVSNDPEEIRRFYDEVGGNLAIKTMGPHAYASRGRSKDTIYGLYTKRISHNLLHQLHFAKYCPSLLQEYIEKRLEIRVTIVDDEVFACEIHSQDMPETKEDWRHPRFVYSLKHCPHQLPETISQKCKAMLQRFNLLFGAFDLVLTLDDHYVFLEMNANGQWLWIEDLTSLKITEAIVRLFTK